MDDQAFKIAESLLQIKAIKLQPHNPFTWASGWKSPIYCDNRKILSYPQVRDTVRDQFTERIKQEFELPDVIAGVATGGIAIGALVAQQLNLPFVYVRSEPKKHGLTNMIEGVIEEGQTVLIVEDLVSTGNSSLKALKALQQAGCNVLGMLAIFTYEFKAADDNFTAANCKLITLSNYSTLIAQALNTKEISEEDAASLAKWREAPSEWMQ